MKSPIKYIKNKMNQSFFRTCREEGVLIHTLLCYFLLDAFRDPKGRQIAQRASKNRYIAKLRKKYRPEIQRYLAENPDVASLPHVRSNKVWFCWLQGLDQAPEVVKKCHAVLKKNLPEDRELVLITEENFTDYITLPDYIMEKYRKGEIIKAFLADCIRINLLISYGGTWIDSTVFLENGDIPKSFLDSDFFFFQFTDIKSFYRVNTGYDDRCLIASNWFLTSCTNQEVLLLTRYLLYLYWEKEKAKDYFIFHYLMQLSLETYREIWEKVPFFCAKNAFVLRERLFDPYNEEEWEVIRRSTPLHKLSYKDFSKRTPAEGSYGWKYLHGELDN